jgi:cytochrome c oxidase subunit 1
LRIGAVFALIGGLVNWFPLMTGLTLHTYWVKAQFVTIFLGVNLTFFPIHFLGLAGMPRRYSDYPDAFRAWNSVASVGSLISSAAAFGLLLVIWEALISKRVTLASKFSKCSLDLAHAYPPINHSYNSTPLIYIFRYKLMKLKGS